MSGDLIEVSMTETVTYGALLTRSQLAHIIGCAPSEVEVHMTERDNDDDDFARYGLVGNNPGLLDWITDQGNAALIHYTTEDRTWSTETRGTKP